MPIPDHQFSVPQEWCDYNEHFSDCYYLIPFSTALDLVLDSVGLGKNYRKSNSFSTYTVESHLRYLHEAKVGENLMVSSEIHQGDHKRLFTRHTMKRNEVIIATCEFVCLHVDITIPKSTAFPSDVYQRIQAAVIANSPENK